MTDKEAELRCLVADLQAEVLEQCRINGMGAERELALLAKIERLERENAKLVKDAKRYRWIRAHHESVNGMVSVAELKQGDWSVIEDLYGLPQRSLDSAIDTAMEKTNDQS